MNVKRDPVRAWLLTALLFTLLTDGLIAAVLAGRGETIRSGLGATAPGAAAEWLRGATYDDSWAPMFSAYRQKAEKPGGSMYDVFFNDHIKFQYPPSSLLLFDFFPAPLREPENGKMGEPMARMLRWLSRVALLLTVFVSAMILEVGVNGSGRVVKSRIILSLVLGLTYYPVLIAYGLGQIQVFLNVFIALAVLFYLLEKKTMAGICLGICCLVKPQYAVILLWALSRKNWRFVSGFALGFLPGLVLSAIRFGLQDHFRYLDVLKVLSLQGESFWYNQSVNGFMNRLLENGSPFSFGRPTALAPYHPVVYAMTMVSSAVILILALWPRENGSPKSKTSTGLLVALAASTLASPVAWNHHYGAFLPIFAAGLPLLMRVRPFGRATAPLLLLSYVAMADVMRRPELIFSNRWLGLAGSHLFFGAMILFGLLLVLRQKKRGGGMIPS